MSGARPSKCAVGARELIGLLRDRLGDLPGVCRNLDQSRSGGTHFRVAGHAIEVKRGELLGAYVIEHAERQAGDDFPVVAWWSNGGRWRSVVMLDLGGFADVLRERLDAPANMEGSGS